MLFTSQERNLILVAFFYCRPLIPRLSTLLRARMKGLLKEWRSHHCQHQTSPDATPEYPALFGLGIDGSPGLLSATNIFYPPTFYGREGLGGEVVAKSGDEGV